MIINQFALYAVPGLHLAENVFDDGLAGFGIVTDCVPALPASVFALSDISFPVRSSLWHNINSFATNNTVTKGTKLPKKPSCYQKVIICLRQFPPLIFVYCGAILALPGTFSLVTAVRFLNA